MWEQGMGAGPQKEALGAALYHLGSTLTLEISPKRELSKAPVVLQNENDIVCWNQVEARPVTCMVTESLT